MNWSLWSKWFLLCSFVVSLVGCASGRPILRTRKGFFDRFSQQERTPNSAQAKWIPTQSVSQKFQWPLKQVQITSLFGKRGRQFHEGIDLKAKTGTSVFAAQSGKVLYSGSKIRGYGQMVVIRHEQGVATIYAHNSKLLVREGQTVKQGQLIAISGRTGHATGPHLHFEVRNGTQPVDPLSMFPESRMVAKTHIRMPAAQSAKIRGSKQNTVASK
jgi:murein DD-endopeptidase MepM/ murein hydrolase activator NlpD